MQVPEVLIVAGILLGWALIYMTAWWVASVVMRRTDVADVGWGLGFVTFAWWGALLIAPEPIGARVWFMAAFVTVWGVRLAWHIATRNFAPGRREDVRYAEMRLRWGSAWPLRSLLTVFLLQGALMWIVASPITVVLSSTGPPFGWLDVVAVAAWTAGIAFEALGDAQLREWLAEPTNRGRPLTTGVWGVDSAPELLRRRPRLVGHRVARAVDALRRVRSCRAGCDDAAAAIRLGSAPAREAASGRPGVGRVPPSHAGVLAVAAEASVARSSGGKLPGP